MKNLTVKTNTTGTTVVLGAWELRAGSHDTTDYLSRGGTYPGNIDSFKALQSDATNGYAPAPKMALITVTGGADGETIILGGGIDSVLMVLTTDSGASAVACGASVSSKTITLQYLSSSANTTNVMVLYN